MINFRYLGPKRSLKRKRVKDSSSGEESSDGVNQPSTSTSSEYSFINCIIYEFFTFLIVPFLYLGSRRSQRIRVEKENSGKVPSTRSPRKIKSLVKRLSTSESEEEIQGKHEIEKDSSHSQRNLRARKQWNYAKMLADDSENSDEIVDKGGSRTSRRSTRKVSAASSEDVNVLPVHRLRRNLQTRHYNENTESSEEEDDGEGVNIRVSVSSRGRIRRLTAKAIASVRRD